jgi:hypothetical protein
MKRKIGLFVTFLMYVTSIAIAQQPAPVKVQEGLLQGNFENGLTVYKGAPVWPAFSDANPVVMYFNKTPYTGPVPSVESLKVLDAYFSWRRTPEAEAWAK